MRVFRLLAGPLITVVLCTSPAVATAGSDDACPTATGVVRCGTAQPSDAPTGDVIRVAVFDDEGEQFGLGLVDVLNTDPSIRATTISRQRVEAGGLATADCVVARLLGPPEADTPTEATVRALDRFVASGGGYIGEWWGAGAALSASAPAYDFNFDVPARFLHLFSGRASDGYIVQTDNPLTVVADHPVVEGLPDVFAGGGGTEYFVRPVEPFDADLLVVATYEGHGGTNPAIMVGSTTAATGTSNSVLLFFDAIDEPADPELTILWINSVKWACVR